MTLSGRGSKRAEANPGQTLGRPWAARPGARRRSRQLDILPREYLPILIFLGMAVALGLVLILAAVMCTAMMWIMMRGM